MKKGDEKFVTLFFVLIIPLTVLIFAATPAALGTQDTLLRFVPARATAYVHGGAGGANRLIDAFVSIPAELRPREAAMFMYVSSDGSSEQAILLGWSALRGPNEEERQALGVRQAAQLNPTTYVLGGDAVIVAARAAGTTHGSLGDNKVVARALSTMRGVSTLQAWGQSPSLLGTVPMTEGQSPSLVAAIAPTDLLTGAVIVPTDVAATYYPFGFRAPSGEYARTNAVPSLAKTVISEERPSFDPIALLFNLEPARGQSPSLGTVPIAQRDTLLDLLGVPMQTSLFADNETGATSVLLHFPTLAPTKIAPALEQYTAAALPERRSFVMPDNDIVAELIFNIDRYHFQPLADAKVPGTLSLATEHPDLRLILATDGKRGTYLTTNSALLDQASNSKPPSSDCPQLHSQNSLIVQAPETLFASFSPVDKLIPFFKGESIKAELIGDNIIVLCGYH